MMIVCSLCLLLAHLGGTDGVRLEAESARLEGPTIATTRPGFSGSGYVTNIVADNARIVWNYKAHAGLFNVKIGYAAANEKGYDLVVGGSKFSGMFVATGDKFGVKEAGLVELKDGDNEIAIERGWGYFDVDYVELSPAKPPRPLRKPPRALSDPKATPEAKSLMSFLVDQYGRSTVSGQYDKQDNEFIETKTGHTPAIYGGDLIDYSPSRIAFGADPKGVAEGIIRRAKHGQIVTLSWHWNAPSGLINKVYANDRGEKVEAMWWSGFYTRASTFDVSKALADPASEDYKLLLRDIDAIAVQLKKFSDAKVPILWRPLHEADGGWFWWGAKGSEPCLKLWRLLYERLTQMHALHNLIWVWNSTKPDWYPGDDVVDVVATDNYPADHTDPLSGQWLDLVQRFDGKKLLALAEFPGAPDVERMWRYGVRWSYFVSWSGTDTGPAGTRPDILKSVYTSKAVITSDKLPAGIGHGPG